MGNEASNKKQVPAQQKSPYDTILEINLAQRQINNVIKQVNKSKRENEKKIINALAAGDQEKARTYIGQKLNFDAQINKFDDLGMKLDIVKNQIKAVSTHQDVMGILNSQVTPELIRNLQSENPEKLFEYANKFVNAFDSYTAQAPIMDHALKGLNTNNMYTEKIENEMKLYQIQFQMQNKDVVIPVEKIEDSREKQNKNKDEAIAREYYNNLKNP